MVPSDPIPSAALRRHARHCALRSGAPGASPFGSPKTVFSGLRIIASRHAASLYSPVRNRKLVTAFPSPATVVLFRTPIPGSPVPACYFASPPVRSTARSASRLPVPVRSSRCGFGSSPRARCRFPIRHGQLRLSPPLPFGSFTSLRIKAFSKICRQPVRLPNPPDFRSLPATDLLE